MSTASRRYEKQSARKLTSTQESSAPRFTGGRSTVIVHEHGADDAGSSAPGRVLTFEVPKVARGSSQFIIGWVPGRGDDRNATATDAVEW
jgi:hypothetical protein